MVGKRKMFVSQYGAATSHFNVKGSAKQSDWQKWSEA